MPSSLSAALPRDKPSRIFLFGGKAWPCSMPGSADAGFLLHRIVALPDSGGHRTGGALRINNPRLTSIQRALGLAIHVLRVDRLPFACPGAARPACRFPSLPPPECRVTRKCHRQKRGEDRRSAVDHHDPPHEDGPAFQVIPGKVPGEWIAQGPVRNERRGRKTVRITKNEALVQVRACHKDLLKRAEPFGPLAGIVQPAHSDRQVDLMFDQIRSGHRRGQD